MELLLHDILTLKKPHPCGGLRWEVLRTGADLKLRCTTCGHELLLPRHKLIPRIRRVERAAAGEE